MISIRDRDFLPELFFSASRSSGAGGQNVNKVNTKVELRFHVQGSLILKDDEKQLVLIKLSNRINSDGFLHLQSQTERTQYRNKEKVLERFYNMLEKALTIKKKRKPTKPTQASKVKRLEGKRLQKEKKELRRNMN